VRVVGDRSRAWTTYFSTTPACFTPSAAVGSSRISTRAPKYTARAIATHCRSPPERVPTGCSTSRRSIPILASSFLAVNLANLVLSRRIGPKPLVGSEPRKKFRQTDISGTIARSW
jgi:hypothetical protein